MPNFRFRLPAIGDLTFTQKIAYGERKKSLLITGGPGSGKTVVSIYRYLRQMTEDQHAMFFTYHRTLVASIRGTFKQQADLLMPGLSAAQVEALLDNTVGSISEWYFEKFRKYLPRESDDNITANIETFSEEMDMPFHEVFIDEAQDLKPNILNSIFSLSAKVSCGADRAQDLQGHYIEPADDYILKLLGEQEKVVLPQGLTRNFRNTVEIFDFARKFVPEDIGVQNIDVSQLKNGEKPEVYRRDLQSQLSVIKDIITENPNSNIGILVHFGWQIKIITDFLEANDYSCEDDAPEEKSFSFYHFTMAEHHRGIMERNLRSPFVLTFESCKGLEFDIVIMPMFEEADKALKLPKKNNDEIDRTASGDIKYFATPNHYYVACTRARSLLYIMYTNKPGILRLHEVGD